MSSSPQRLLEEVPLPLQAIAQERSMFTTRVQKILAGDSVLDSGSSVCYPEAQSGCAFLLQIETSRPRVLARALINMRQREVVRGLLRTTAENEHLSRCGR